MVDWKLRNLHNLVKSFGTEDRKAKQQIEARDTVYKLIRFKGVDIDGIYLENIVNNEFVDPAILDVNIFV